MSTADHAPTRQVVEVFEELAGRVDQERARWQAVLDGEIAAFRALLRRHYIPVL